MQTLITDVSRPSLNDYSLEFTLSLDAFVRSIEIQKNSPHGLFLGAGASISSGLPSAQKCIWEWKRSIFLSNNPGLEEQFAELSLANVQQKIQAWLDRQGGYPPKNSSEEYSFYIEQCYPDTADRGAFFQEQIRGAQPHIGYKVLCHLANSDIIRSTWTTNFDSLTARAAANYSLSPFEVGIDSQARMRPPKKGEILCVSLHGDYRYDDLKNTSDELQRQEGVLKRTFIDDAKNTSFIICGYSGRDQSIMDMLNAAYSSGGTGTLYWCGYGDEIPKGVTELIKSARKAGRKAFYVPTNGFDDLMIRLGLYCLKGSDRENIQKIVSDGHSIHELRRDKFSVARHDQSTIIKSNAFEIECPSEVYQFDLNAWPKEKVWKWLDEISEKSSFVAVPFKGKVLALGIIDDIRDAFNENIKGTIDRVPISLGEYGFRDGAIVSLMKKALTRSIEVVAQVNSDGKSELWIRNPLKREKFNNTHYAAYSSVLLNFRMLNGRVYLVLKPSIKVLDIEGKYVPYEISAPLKLGILGYQHNKEFNQAVNSWRKLIHQKDKPTSIFEFPYNCGSTFKFKIRKAPIFAQIGLADRKRVTPIPDKVRPLIIHQGIELNEPSLVFSNKSGGTPVQSPHPIKGMLENRPFDFPLTLNGLSSSLKIGVICPQSESGFLQAFLLKSQQTLSPERTERDYLVNYPGFQAAYGLTLDIPTPSSSGWMVCPEPSNKDPQKASLEIANYLNQAIESLRSSYSPNVVIIYFPDRWKSYRGFRTDGESFDVHDFVKAYCVHRGVSTQFLNQHTLSNNTQCRIWWWLSLALYVKSMRTPWVLNGLEENTAYVGLGFSLDHSAEKGKHVVLGCSHIYSARGEGLQYRLSRLENSVIRQGNAFMSKEDARRLGETIRQLFYESKMTLPSRVVIHKRTPFLKEEREGLHEGLSGIDCVEMLEIQVDDALRYVASVPTDSGTIDEDGFPVRRGTTLKLDDYRALLWVHGTTDAVKPGWKYYQGKRRIPAPLVLKRHAGFSDLRVLSEEILGLSKMNWNNFDLYTKLPATLQSSNEIARIGSLLQRFGAESYDYRLFI